MRSNTNLYRQRAQLCNIQVQLHVQPKESSTSYYEVDENKLSSAWISFWMTSLSLNGHKHSGSTKHDGSNHAIIDKVLSLADYLLNSGQSQQTWPETRFYTRLFLIGFRNSLIRLTLAYISEIQLVFLKLSCLLHLLRQKYECIRLSGEHSDTN